MDIATLTAANLIGAYRAIRERKEGIVDKHKVELAPYNTQLGLLEAELLSRMATEETNSFSTDKGTAYKSVVASVRVADSGAFFDWLRETGNWQYAEIRAAKKEVEAYVDENAALPPGLDINRAVKCGVRKPTGVN